MIELGQNAGVVPIVIIVSVVILSAGAALLPPTRDFRVFFGAVMMSGAWIVSATLGKVSDHGFVDAGFFALNFVYMAIFYWFSRARENAPPQTVKERNWGWLRRVGSLSFNARRRRPCACHRGIWPQTVDGCGRFYMRADPVLGIRARFWFAHRRPFRDRSVCREYCGRELFPCGVDLADGNHIRDHILARPQRRATKRQSMVIRKRRPSLRQTNASISLELANFGICQSAMNLCTNSPPATLTRPKGNPFSAQQNYW